MSKKPEDNDIGVKINQTIEHISTMLDTFEDPELSIVYMTYIKDILISLIRTTKEMIRVQKHKEKEAKKSIYRYEGMFR